MIVFLDIDGPVCTKRSIAAGFKYDPLIVVALNDFLSRENVKVVLSSTIRILDDRPERSALRLANEYGLQGFQFHKDWRTGKNYGAGRRSQEIQEWLGRNPREQGPFVVIDDEDVQLEEEFIQIKASPNDGISFIGMMQMRAFYDIGAQRELAAYRDWLSHSSG